DLVRSLRSPLASQAAGLFAVIPTILPLGPKPVLRKLSEHVFGVKPRHLQRNKLVPLQVETRPRLTQQIPKLAKATSESGLKVSKPRHYRRKSKTNLK